MEQEPGVNKNARKLMELKNWATGLGLSVTLLGMPNDIKNDEATTELINQFGHMIQNFENTKTGFQKEVDALTQTIFNRKS